MLVAIHQPNFFPWIGYFDKIAQSDVFVFLDHVQFQKTGGVWTNRVKLMLGGEARWVTTPVDRSYHGVLSIKEVSFSENEPWRGKLIKSLKLNYSKSPFFEETMDYLEPLVLNSEKNISIYNSTAVMEISRKLGFSEKKFRWSSQIGAHGQATEMLTELILVVGGTSYLCGGGATGYQEDELFVRKKIKLIYQNFRHPIYDQAKKNDFESGLSILDALMCCGLEKTKSFF